MYIFDHIGIPTDTVHPGESGSEELKQYCTDPQSDPMHIEYLRFLPGCEGPEMLKTRPHIAFYVDDLHEAAAAMDSVVFGPFSNDTANIVFGLKDGLLFELMEKI